MTLLSLWKSRGKLFWVGFFMQGKSVKNFLLMVCKTKFGVLIE